MFCLINLLLFLTFSLSSLSLLLKLLNNETPAEANSFNSPFPIINIHVGFPGNDPGKFKGAGGGGGVACILKPFPFLDLNHCFSEVIDEKRHPLPNSRIRVLQSIQPCPVSIKNAAIIIISVIIIPQILGLKGSKTKPYVIKKNMLLY